MSLLFLRANRRALPVAGAFALIPVCFVGALTLAARPSLALQDAKDAPKDDKTYTIARSYKVNEVNHYQINVNTKANIPPLGGDVTIAIAMKMKETVKSVKPDGTATLQSEFDEANVKIKDMEQDLTASMPIVTTTADKQGHVLSTKMEGGDPQFTQGQGAQMLNSISKPGLYPPKPVKIGDSWKIDPAKDKEADKKADKPGDKGADKNAAKTMGTATLMGLETIDGVPTLKIKVVSDSEATIDNPINPGDKLDIKTHTQGFSNIETVSGKLVKATATVESEGGPFGKTTSELTFALVKDGDKLKPDANKTGKKATDK